MDKQDYFNNPETEEVWFTSIQDNKIAVERLKTPDSK
jgi:hypothetical protein